MGLFDIFSGKSANDLKAAGQQAQQQLYTAGNTAQGAYNTAGQNAQRDFSALGTMAGQGYGNAANTAGATLDAGTAGSQPYYNQARGEYNGLAFSPDLYGGTMRQGYETMADATGANGAAGLDRARALFTATPGYQEGLDRAVNEATRVANARGVAVGNSLADTTKLATSYANQNYGDFVNRLSPFANAPNAQLARDQAAAGYGLNLAGARAGIDTGQAGALTNAANTKAALLAGLTTQGINAQTGLAGQGYGLGYQGATGGASANLGAQTAGTQANLQSQQKAVEAQNAANAQAWNAILGVGKMAVGAATGMPIGGGDLFGGGGSQSVPSPSSLPSGGSGDPWTMTFQNGRWTPTV